MHIHICQTPVISPYVVGYNFSGLHKPDSFLRGNIKYIRVSKEDREKKINKKQPWVVQKDISVEGDAGEV